MLDLLIHGRHRRRRHRRAGAHRRRRVRDGRIADDRSASTTTPHATIDADGLLVTPGFVDIHTHYDAQLHWDPTASPASWHGVTTLLTGNCGFTLAPAEPDDLAWLLLRCSAASRACRRDALAAGVTFRGGSLGDFLGGLDGRVGVNVGANVGHSAVRRYVMGDDASERTATDDEIARDAGARPRRDARRRDRVHHRHSSSCTSRTTAAACRRTTPHPTSSSRWPACSPSSAAARSSSSPARFLDGYDDDDRALMLRDGPRVGTARAPQHAHRDAARARRLVAQPRVRRDRGRRRPRDPPDVRRRTGRAPTSRSGRRSCSTRCRASATRSRSRRPHARTACATRSSATRCGPSSPTRGPLVRVRVGGRCSVETVQQPEHERCLDRSVAGDRRRARASTRSTRSSTSRSPRTSRCSSCSPRRRRRPARTRSTTMMRSPVDDGRAAPTAARTCCRFCGADYTTRLLTEWVPTVLTLEQAVARLTSIPARATGIPDRGRSLPARRPT